MGHDFPEQLLPRLSAEITAHLKQQPVHQTADKAGSLITA
jgi:hypothetical protein